MSKFESMLKAADLAAKRINAQAEHDVELARQQQADQMLWQFRELLAEHNISRHEIRIRTGMGTSFLTLDGEEVLFVGDVDRFAHYNGATLRLPVIQTLRWIENHLHHSWDYLIPDNTLLNQPKDKS